MLSLAPLLLLLLSLFGSSSTLAVSSQHPMVTIIIDDIGNSLKNGRRALNLPGPITYAILPFRPHSNALSKQAHKLGKEVILHMPMANTRDESTNIGRGGLTLNQDRGHYEQQLQRAIAATPHISGINNHMGSLLTSDITRMQWLMQSLKQYPLYFIDSRTSANSVAAIIAVKHQIPTLKRDVFLDHDPSIESIDKQFKKLIKIAQKKGSAVAIGHPHSSTLSYLEQKLPQLHTMGIDLVKPSTLLSLRLPEQHQTQIQQKLAKTVSPDAPQKKVQPLINTPVQTITGLSDNALKSAIITR